MAKILEMPKLSPTMEEGVLAAWHKKEGDAVKVDDLLAEVETDKATMEFRVFDNGTILKLLVAPGSLVKLGQPVAILGSPGEAIPEIPSSAAAPVAPSAKAAPTQEQSAPAPAAAPAPATPPAPPAPKAAPTNAGPLTRAEHLLERTAWEPAASPASPASPEGDGHALASPFIRKRARDLGLDLTLAQGTGPFGRITTDDVDALRGSPRAVAKAGSTQRDLSSESRPLSMMRKTIARRLTESKQSVPHFYLSIDINAEPLAKLREELVADLAKGAEKDAEPMKVSVNDLIIRACAKALRRVPEANATFTPEAILIHRRVDISVAVAIPDGLVTPVLRDADTKSVLAIAKETRELATRARAKKLTPEEMQGGTFSISNLGMFGIDSFSAVINPPEGAILAVGQIRAEPVVKDGAVVPGKKLAMTLSCDHRVIDGSVGATFLAELRRLLEHPLLVLAG